MGLLERVSLLVKVRGNAKYSIHEGVHLLCQVGEGGHARGKGGYLVVPERQPVDGNEEDVSSIKSLYLHLQLGHARQPRGYRGDLIEVEIQSIDAK